MGRRISLPVIAGPAVGIGIIIVFAIVFNSPTSSISPTSPTIASDDAIRIVGNDILRGNREVGMNYTVTDIAVNVPKFSNYVPTYVSFEEFREKDMKLPLAYVGSNSNATVIRIFENGSSEYIGECHSGLPTYCGYRPPFELGYQGRLVYGVEMLVLSSKDDTKTPLFYVVDATNGQIVDSSYVRMQNSQKVSEFFNKQN